VHSADGGVMQICRSFSVFIRTFGAFTVAAIIATVVEVMVGAQAPHGGASLRPQPGANVNAAGGVVADPNDPAAIVKSDILLQRQNETVIAPSFRNPDALMAAWNDYRFVDFPHDQFFGEQT